MNPICVRVLVKDMEQRERCKKSFGRNCQGNVLAMGMA
jgi:hypothetical protein